MIITFVMNHSLFMFHWFGRIFMSFLMKITMYSRLFILLFCVSASINAEVIKDSEPRDIEIGAGGNIKLEKPYRTEIEEMYEWHAHLLYESRYITEGRDNLSGNAISSVSTEFSYKDIAIVPWVASGIGVDYSEFNLNIVYGMKLLGNLEFFAGYNYAHSHESGVSSSDNEISLDLVYFHHNNFQLLSTFYYSFDAGGTFTELTIKKDHRFNSDFIIDLRSIIGFNSGYVTDGHDGINFVQLRANISYQLMNELELYAYTGYNISVNRDAIRYTGDELLQDFFWSGIGLSYRF